MNFVNQCLSIILLISLSIFAYAEKIQDNTVNELIILSGLKSQIEDLPDTVVEMMKQNMPDLSDENKKQAELNFRNVFNPDYVMKDIASEIQKTMTVKDAQAVIAWYESNTGNRIARAEEYASSPEAMGEFQRAAPEVLANKELLATAKKLVDEMLLVEESIEFQKVVMLATMVGLSKATKPDQPIDLKQLKDFVNMQIDQAKNGLEQMITAQLAFAYKDIDKASMSAYFDELKTAPMKKFNKSQSNGIKTALNKSLDRLMAIK